MNVTLRVREHMVTDVATVTPETDIMRVIEILRERDISGVIVIDGSGVPVGIVTERDCIVAATQSGYFGERGGPAAEFMSSPVASVGPDDSLMDVAERMATSEYRRFPVVDEGRLVGLIGRRDVLRVLASGGWFDR